jgi:hypothetical protein
VGPECEEAVDDFARTATGKTRLGALRLSFVFLLSLISICSDTARRPHLPANDRRHPSQTARASPERSRRFPRGSVTVDRLLFLFSLYLFRRYPHSQCRNSPSSSSLLPHFESQQPHQHGRSPYRGLISLLLCVLSHLVRRECRLVSDFRRYRLWRSRRECRFSRWQRR